MPADSPKALTAPRGPEGTQSLARELRALRAMVRIATREYGLRADRRELERDRFYETKRGKRERRSATQDTESLDHIIDHLAKTGHPDALKIAYKWAELQGRLAAANEPVPPESVPATQPRSPGAGAPYRPIGRNARNRGWIQLLPEIFAEGDEWVPRAEKVAYVLRAHDQRVRLDHVRQVLHQLAVLRKQNEPVVREAIEYVRERRRHYRAVLAGREKPSDFDEEDLDSPLPDAVAARAAGWVEFRNTIAISDARGPRERMEMWKTHRPDPVMLLVAMKIEVMKQLSVRRQRSARTKA